MDGDLVIQNIKLQFDKYLKEQKSNNIGERFDMVADCQVKDSGRIEFYPKMIESVYQFLVANSRYKEIMF